MTLVAVGGVMPARNHSATLPETGRYQGDFAGAAREDGGVDEHVAPEDAEDHAEDERALPGERDPLLLLHQPEVEEDRAARGAEQVDEVLDEEVALPERGLVGEEGQVELRVVGEAEAGQRAELRHQEGDEDPDVRRSGRPLRLGGHAALADAVEEQLLGARPGVVPAHVLAREEQRPQRYDGPREQAPGRRRSSATRGRVPWAAEHVTSHPSWKRALPSWNRAFTSLRRASRRPGS